jgi:hypothetical protein
MSEVKVDTISERTAAAGVTIDGVLIKDSIVNTDNIAEKTATAGVTIDGVLIKDSLLKIPGGSPGADKVLTSDASGNATWGAGATSAGINLLINGNMQVWQRATAATATSTGGNTYTTVDRWKLGGVHGGAYTSERYSMTAAEKGTTGHGFALKLVVTTADTSIAASDRALVPQQIEAQNLQNLKYGSASAEDLTLSFWVKSSKTGIYCVWFNKQDATNYLLPIEYTISSADTWEQKTIAVSPTAGSTALITSAAGEITEDNGAGIQVGFMLAGGTDFHGTNNTWTTNTAAYGTSSQVNWLNTLSEDFYLTGVQLEIGTTATTFEYKTFAQELAACQRYYEKSYDTGTNPGTATASSAWLMRHPTAGPGAFFITYKVPKRTNPTTVTYGRVSGTSGKVTNMSGGAADITGTFISGGIQSTVVYWTSTGSETYTEGQWTADADM